MFQIRTITGLTIRKSGNQEKVRELKNDQGKLGKIRELNFYSTSAIMQFFNANLLREIFYLCISYKDKIIKIVINIMNVSYISK